MRELTFELCKYVELRGGKFLEKETDEKILAELRQQHPAHQNDWWYPVHPLKAREKSSQAIRESSSSKLHKAASALS